MPSSTIEDYIREIYRQEFASPDRLARTAKIAEALSVTPGTATVMLQGMQRSGYVDYVPRRGCRLTQQGRESALRLVRAHRLIELFLQKFLGLDWGEVHDEADAMEHCFSPRIIDRIDELLGFPEKDPHGETIPRREATSIESDDQPLDSIQVEGNYLVTRIIRQDREFLDQCKSLGLLPNAELELLRRNDVLSIVEIRIGGGPLGLSLDTASHIFVRLLY